jgi:heme/copper-type cytochrome/quinol oxidase subunit 2
MYCIVSTIIVRERLQYHGSRHVIIVSIIIIIVVIIIIIIVLLLFFLGILVLGRIRSRAASSSGDNTVAGVVATAADVALEVGASDV